jgi:hypothetical protein
MISKYFNDLESDWLRQLEDRYQRLTPDNKIEFHKQVQQICICNEKIERIEEEIKIVKEKIKIIKRNRSYDIFFATMILLGSVVFSQLFDFSKTSSQIVFVMVLFSFAWISVGLLYGLGDLIAWLSQDKRLRFERAVYWIEFKNLTITEQLDSNALRIDDSNSEKFNFNNEDREIIFERILKRIESI